MTKTIATHNKIFHADEVTAVALLKLFTQDEIVVQRVDHNKEDFSKFDMVIDISRTFDGVKYFDHHQHRGGKSSAGLIWEYLGVEKEYPKISKLIKLVDDNDVGIAKAKPFEYSSLIRCFNSDSIDSSAQDEAFDKAVEFAVTILHSLKVSQENLLTVKEIINNSCCFNNNPHIIKLERFTSHWTTCINGQIRPEIKAVVWQDKEDGKFKVKIPPKKVGSFELNGKALKQDSKNMEFVHSAGFFAIAKSEECMREFLSKI